MQVHDAWASYGQNFRKIMIMDNKLCWNYVWTTQIIAWDILAIHREKYRGYCEGRKICATGTYLFFTALPKNSYPPVWNCGSVAKVLVGRVLTLTSATFSNKRTDQSANSCAIVPPNSRASIRALGTIQNTCVFDYNRPLKHQLRSLMFLFRDRAITKLKMLSTYGGASPTTASPTENRTCQGPWIGESTKYGCVAA